MLKIDTQAQTLKLSGNPRRPDCLFYRVLALAGRRDAPDYVWWFPQQRPRLVVERAAASSDYSSPQIVDFGPARMSTPSPITWSQFFNPARAERFCLACAPSAGCGSFGYITDTSASTSSSTGNFVRIFDPFSRFFSHAYCEEFIFASCLTI